MPASRSAQASTRQPTPPPRRPRYLLPLALIIVLAVVVVAVAVLPASLMARALPPLVRAEDFSGSLWHGSAGRLLVGSRDVGAIEWRLHPAQLLRLRFGVELHWVKLGFVADGTVEVSREGATARQLTGGGPIEDLTDLGVPPGWHGASHFDFSEIRVEFADATVIPKSVLGDATVVGLGAPQFASGADLGGYAMKFADALITPDIDATAVLSDTGGPLEVRATVRYSAGEHSAMLSGTVKDRPDAPLALRTQVDDLAELHARDAEGRVQVDFELTL